MSKLLITETVLRDAHQSLAATRMTTEEMLPILEAMDDKILELEKKAKKKEADDMPNED